MHHDRLRDDPRLLSPGFSLESYCDSGVLRLSLPNRLVRVDVIPEGWKVYKLGSFAPQQDE